MPVPAKRPVTPAPPVAGPDEYPRSGWRFRWCDLAMPFLPGGKMTAVACDVTGNDNPGDYSLFLPVPGFQVNTLTLESNELPMFARLLAVGPGHDDRVIGKPVRDTNVRECLFSWVWFKAGAGPDDWLPGRCVMVHLDSRGEVTFVVVSLTAGGSPVQVAHLASHHVRPMTFPTF